MNLEVVMASVPDRESLVAEVWQGEHMVAELSRASDGRVEIEIYGSSPPAPWRFDLAMWLETLAEAKRRLG